MPHWTALSISGVPVTRPPIWSVRRRKFSIIGESPRINGISLFAACAHEDASVAEHVAALWAACSLLSASVCDGASCAADGAMRTTQERNVPPNTQTMNLICEHLVHK